GPLRRQLDRAGQIGDAGGVLAQLAPTNQAAPIDAQRELRPQPQRTIEGADARAEERLISAAEAPVAPAQAPSRPPVGQRLTPGPDLAMGGVGQTCAPSPSMQKMERRLPRMRRQIAADMFEVPHESARSAPSAWYECGCDTFFALRSLPITADQDTTGA